MSLTPSSTFYGCGIGDDAMIGTFVEIQGDATIGARCRIHGHASICSGVTPEEDVFIGHGAIFTNDRHTSTAGARGGGWKPEKTAVRLRASTGSGALIMGKVTVNAGTDVIEDVAAGAVVAGVPARLPSQ